MELSGGQRGAASIPSLTCLLREPKGQRGTWAERGQVLLSIWGEHSEDTMENGWDGVCTIAGRPARSSWGWSIKEETMVWVWEEKRAFEGFLRRCRGFDITYCTLLVWVIALLFNHIVKVFLG